MRFSFIALRIGLVPYPCPLVSCKLKPQSLSSPIMISDIPFSVVPSFQLEWSLRIVHQFLFQPRWNQIYRLEHIDDYKSRLHIRSEILNYGIVFGFFYITISHFDAAGLLPRLAHFLLEIKKNIFLVSNSFILVVIYFMHLLLWIIKKKLWSQ